MKAESFMGVQLGMSENNKRMVQENTTFAMQIKKKMNSIGRILQRYVCIIRVTIMEGLIVGTTQVDGFNLPT